MRVVIAGNANSGKTTLFNALTGSNAHVGNWHGVTVNVRSAYMTGSDKKIEIIDLPGLNSFTPYTEEEKTSVEFLRRGDYDVIVNVIEASRLIQAKNLTESLHSLSKPVICIVNMFSDLKQLGGNIDFDILSKSGVNVFQLDVTFTSDVKILKNALIKCDFESFYKFDFSFFDRAFISPKSYFNKFDDLLTNKFFALLTFSVSVVFIFWLAFGSSGIGGFLSGLIADSFDAFSDFVSKKLCDCGINFFVSGLICRGVPGGVGSILSFLPQIVILDFCLIYLEQSGIISRLSFAFDGVLSKIGLNGRALFSLLMGFGCTTVAVESTAGLEDRAIKRRAVLLLPFMSCTAKTPVYVFIASLCAVKKSFLFPLTAIAIGVILSLVTAYSKVLIYGTKSEPLILDMPTLRLKCLKNTVKPLINSVKQFIIKIVSVGLMVSVGVYLASSVSLRFEILCEADTSNSVLAILGKIVSKAFLPVGIDSGAVGASLIAGLFAKESIISTLGILAPNGINLSIASGVALCTFIALYPPCLVAFDSMRRAIGLKSALLSAILQTVIALATSYIAYFLITRFVITAVALILLALIAFIIKAEKNREKFYRQGKRKTF